MHYKRAIATNYNLSILLPQESMTTKGDYTKKRKKKKYACFYIKKCFQYKGVLVQ